MLGPEDLVGMVTINAAKALEVDQFLGSLEVVNLADLFVIAGDPDTPYESLIQSNPSDVSLVMVDGKILFGDKAIEAAATFEGCEEMSICGTGRFLCVAEPSSENE